VELGAQFVWRGGDDRESADPFPGRRMPVLPQTRERHDAAIGERERIGLLPGRGFAPFIKVVDRHQAAPALERFAECRLVLGPLGLGIDIGEADLDVPWTSKGSGPSTACRGCTARPWGRSGRRAGSRSAPRSSLAENLVSASPAGSRRQA
jgi:hypothetical protein